MKKLLFILSSLIAAFAVTANAAVNFSVASVSCEPNADFPIVVEIDNGSTTFVAFQCDMYLADGITLTPVFGGNLMMDLTKRCDDHGGAIKEMSKGVYRFMSYSETNAPFSGVSGAVFSTPAKAPSVEGNYTITLKNVRITEPVATELGYREVKCPDVAGVLTVKNSEVLANRVILSKSALELTIGESETLTATVLPATTTDKTVKWTSSDSSVATVDINGHITAFSAGETVITATCGPVSAKCSVKVVKKQQEIFWDQTFGEVKVGDVVMLEASSSSGLDVIFNLAAGRQYATLSGNVLTFTGVGNVTVTATQPGNDVYDAAQTVSKRFSVISNIVDAAEIVLSKTQLDLMVGDTAKINATVYPEETSDKNVTWTSSNPNVVYVDADGNIEALRSGSAEITATCGSISASCFVTVSKKEQMIVWNQQFDMATVGDVIELKAQASSGLEIVYSVAAGANCITLSGNSVTLLSPGTVTITASQGGNEEFNAAESVSKTFTIIRVSIAGDFDGSGDVNVNDLQVLINAVLNSSQDSHFDLTGEGRLDTGDIVKMIDIVMGR